MKHFKDIIAEESKKEYYKKLHDFVDNEYVSVKVITMPFSANSAGS